MAGLCALALTGEAAADTYNFWLKSNSTTPFGGTTKCAVGSFSFTKNGVTTGSPVTSPTMSISAGCITTNSPAVALTLTGSLNAVVRNISMNGQNQGPNMDGVTGTISSTQFTKACRISKTVSGTQLAQWHVIFSSVAGAAGAPGTRQFQLQEQAGACTTGTPNFSSPATLVLVANAPYQVFNNSLNPLPEPATLWLALAGLGGLAWSRRRRQA